EPSGSHGARCDRRCRGDRRDGPAPLLPVPPGRRGRPLRRLGALRRHRGLGALGHAGAGGAEAGQGAAARRSAGPRRCGHQQRRALGHRCPLGGRLRDGGPRRPPGHPVRCRAGRGGLHHLLRRAAAPGAVPATVGVRGQGAGPGLPRPSAVRGLDRSHLLGSGSAGL
ncbi:MAG: hypothetical protein AVDCRST_MAG76-2426, partial [uncultured Acidimicrobiales bacterium]